jgi:uncharacterized protein (TIGR02421 family)
VPPVDDDPTAAPPLPAERAPLDPGPASPGRDHLDVDDRPPAPESGGGAGGDGDGDEEAWSELPEALAAVVEQQAAKEVDPEYRQTVYELSERLRELQRPINILSALRWPKDVERSFFAAGATRQPEVTRDSYAPLRYEAGELIRALEDLHADVRNRLGRFNPVGQLLTLRCQEWRETVSMLSARGTPDFARIAGLLYGRTSDAFHAGGPTVADMGLDLAERLGRIEATGMLPPDPRTMTAVEGAAWLQERLDRVFDEDPVSVQVSDEIVAEAIAGADRIRLRSDAMFSERALRILEVHEAYVHVATTMNGRRQPTLTFLDKGPPSTTIGQEGLAVLVEVTAFTSHPTRLRRINDRVEAIHRIEDGATFLDIYRWFLDERGATPQAAYSDTTRVFRGSLPDAGPYPKDLAYARGFVQTYNFFRVSVAQGKVFRLWLLFTGKTALDRIGLLFQAFDEGLLAPPRYLPPHFADPAGLASWLAYSGFLNQLDLERVEDDFSQLL